MGNFIGSYDPLSALQSGMKFQQDFRDRDRLDRIQSLRDMLAEKTKQSGFNPLFDPTAQELIAQDPGALMAVNSLMSLSKDRQRMFVDDLQKAYRLSKAGKIGEVLKLATERKQKLLSLDPNADTQDTDAIIGAIAQGQDPTPLLEAPMIAMGLLDDPETARLKQEEAYIKRSKDILGLEKLKKEVAGTLGSGGNNKPVDVQKFMELQRLKKEGTPEQIAEYRRIIGLDQPLKLSSTAEKSLERAQSRSFELGTAANMMQLLANDISKIDIGGGVASTFSEKLKQLTGSQDEVSNLRKQFNSIRSSQAVTNLPPGVASDKDIELALSGFPPENAPSEMIISFLNGQAKLAKIEAAWNDFRADYISTTKGIAGFGKAWREKMKEESFASDIGLDINKKKATTKDDLKNLSIEELQELLMQAQNQ